MGLYIRVSDRIDKKFMLDKGFTYIADCYYKDVSLPSNTFNHPLNEETIKYLSSCLNLYKEVEAKISSPSYKDDKDQFEADFSSLQKEKDNLLLSQHKRNEEINKEIEEMKGKLDKLVYKEKYNEAREKIISEYNSTWKDQNLKDIQSKIDSLFEKNRIILLAKEFENDKDSLNKKIQDLNKSIEEMSKFLKVYSELSKIIDEALKEGPSVQIFLLRTAKPLSKALSRNSFTPSALIQLDKDEILTIYRP